MVYFLFIIIVTPGVYPRLVLAQVPCVARGIFRTLLKKTSFEKEKKLAYVTPGYPWSSLKKLSQFNPAV